MSRRPRLEASAVDEPAPEVDRLEGFPHPRQTTTLHGHAEAERALLASIASGRMHHAWLVTGPEGIGKATLSYRAAKFLLSRGAAPALIASEDLATAADVPAVRQVVALSHPGLLVIRRAWDPQKKRTPQAITVDEVRRLKNFLAHSVEPGAYRVVIVDQADEMNANAANALLKSLEEPPARTVFLLVASEPGRLPATIGSRCRRLDLKPLPEADLAAAVAGPLAASQAPPLDADRARLLAALSRGSVRRALQLGSKDGLKLYGRLLGLVAALPRLDHAAVQKLATELSGPAAEQAFDMGVALLTDMLGRLVRQAATGAGAIAGEAEIAERLLAPKSLATYAALWETIGRDKTLAQTLNLDRKAFIVETFLRLEGLGRGGAGA